MILKPFNPTSENEDGNDQCRHQQAPNIENGNEEGKKETISLLPGNSASEEKSVAESNAVVVSNENYNAPGNVVILESMLQGSNEWKEARRGRITMSHAKDLITKPRKKGEVSQTRLTYLINVASEIITGVTAETFKSWKMERGNILEPFARDAYKAHTGNEISQVGLGYLNKDRRISGSPDGLGVNLGMEIKCQDPKKHLATILNGFEPKEFDPQIQGSMWIFEKECWEYVSFCPEFPEQPIFIHRVYRDEEMIKRIEESALKGVEEIDDFVKRGRFSTTNKQIAKICEDALETIEALSYNEPEFI